MMNEIIKYCRIYSNRQKMRIHYHKFYKKLISILFNNVNLFHIVIINFIINLLFIKNSYSEKISDIILILINKLIKYALYITITKDLKINKFINII